MKINIKNNSKVNVKKTNSLKDFMKFCQIHSPLKDSINVTFVDRSTTEFFNGSYLIPVKTLKLSGCLDLLAQLWVGEFSKQRQIPCSFVESQLLVKFFLEQNTNIKNILNI
jgi:hypothetical protein